MLKSNIDNFSICMKSREKENNVYHSIREKKLWIYQKNLSLERRENNQ